MINNYMTMKNKIIKLLTISLLTAILTINTGCFGPPKWNKATLASCWDGSNAQKRMMNILSPHFSDGKVKDYIKWQKERGANTTHIILSNNADGEGGGYSIYGNSISWQVDKNWVKMAKKRIDMCRKAKLAVVLWLITDDDKGWNKQIAGNANQYLKDLSDNGLLKEASTIVLGLELDEYFNRSGDEKYVENLMNATKKYYKGKIGTHHLNNSTRFVHYGDILFYQVGVNRSLNTIANDTKQALRFGKPVNFFELSRHADKERSQVALDNGAFAVGNCDHNKIKK